MTEYVMSDQSGTVYKRHLVGQGPWHRPVVVIDPEDREEAARLTNLYEDGIARLARAAGVADFPNGNVTTMQAALREFAKPTPPRPEEPTGLGAVVEDAKGRRWVRDHFDGDDAWFWAEPQHDGDWQRRNYDSINVVRVLSE